MPSPSPITRSASHQQCITKYLFKTALVTGMSQLLVYLPAARTSQVTQVHAQQSPISLGTGRPGARGGERGQSRGPVSRPRSGGRSSEPAQPAGPARPPLPTSQVEVLGGVVGKVLGVGDRGVVPFRRTGTWGSGKGGCGFWFHTGCAAAAQRF